MRGTFRASGEKAILGAGPVRAGPMARAMGPEGQAGSRV